MNVEIAKMEFGYPKYDYLVSDCLLKLPLNVVRQNELG